MIAARFVQHFLVSERFPLFYPSLVDLSVLAPSRTICFLPLSSTDIFLFPGYSSNLLGSIVELGLIPLLAEVLAIVMSPESGTMIPGIPPTGFCNVKGGLHRVSERVCIGDSHRLG
jgi:hypothetical protein